MTVKPMNYQLATLAKWILRETGNNNYQLVQDLSVFAVALGTGGNSTERQAKAGSASGEGAAELLCMSV